VKSDFVSEERGEQKDSNKPASSKLSDTDKKETDMDFLNNLTEVIDQIRVESTQEEMPEWAVYKSKPPKIRRVRKRKPLGQMTQFKVKTALHELQHDSAGGGDIGYTVIEKPLGTPMSSGDEDDLKGKRRTTKPISDDVRPQLTDLTADLLTAGFLSTLFISFLTLLFFLCFLSSGFDLSLGFSSATPSLALSSLSNIVFLSFNIVKPSSSCPTNSLECIHSETTNIIKSTSSEYKFPRQFHHTCQQNQFDW
jgi:hypothetical protein